MSNHRAFRIITSLSLLGMPLLGACSGSDTSSGPSDVGGTAGIGGAETNGGTTLSAGALLTGGLQGIGGAGLGGTTTGIGGANLTGGMSATGGAVAVGGTKNAGGATIAPTGGSKSATGGLTSAGGSPATGGAPVTGGMPATGGSKAAAGTSATGGTPTTGGSKSTGGAPGTGGSKATGGGPPTGGAPATGGAKATGGSPATGGATSTSCSAPPAAPALIGYGASTTGGGNATPVTVTTLAALQSAVSGSGAAVIYVKGVLAAGKISVGSNKTIAGICGAEIHGHLGMSGSNVILRNIKVVGYAVGNCALDPDYDSSVGCSSGNDAISVQDGSNFRIDHCDISDGTDGNMDITNGANNVTVSWTKFHYTARTDNSGSDSTGAAGHRFSNLVGGSDNTTSDANALNITWHHNWWADNVMERQPRVRFGHNHIFNNLYTCAGDNYCVRAGIQAHILLQNNAFSGVKSPHEFNSTSDQSTAYITLSGNVYTNCTGTEATGGGGTAFTNPPYTATLDAASSVSAAVQSGAGPK